MRLTLVIASLAGGGAERVMARLAGQWVEQWEKVTLIPLYPESHDYASHRALREVGSQYIPASVFRAVMLGASLIISPWRGA
ncbi:hypothetical protein BH23GEM6_BH23GEM6_22560 [soil metagenome]